MGQVLINGLYSGVQYALIALGLTLIFSLMNVMNFAHGQLYVLGGFVTYYVYGVLGLPFVVALLAAGITLAVVGLLFDILFFRKVLARSARDESTMLLATGTALLLDSLFIIFFGEKHRGVPTVISGVMRISNNIFLPYSRVLIIIISVAVIVFFILFMKYTRCGRGLRAMAQDREAAKLMGVNVDRYSMFGWALAAMLAGLAGAMLVSVSGVNSGLGTWLSIKAFIMVMIGGAGVISGAIIGGLMLGILESFGSSFLPGNQYLAIFIALIIFLAIRPRGLLGRQ
ncbi:MAG: branched-chain amino acid ABC transporter permease [Planctomycetota bacterium]|jgi:branched-chain amino acid transport system permease protein|nr:branched-chain amino acid ABC transporter permease [Planctomycetota bacterium]